MYVKPNGQMARNVHITWSQMPQTIVLCEPFAVALMDSFMEVRNISPTARQCVIQMINDVDRVNVSSMFVGMDKSVFMASKDRRTARHLSFCLFCLIVLCQPGVQTEPSATKATDKHPYRNERISRCIGGGGSVRGGG